MKKLALFFVATVAFGLLLPTTTASAQDLVCAPITADGQPIACVDIQPVDDAVSAANSLLEPVLDPVRAQYAETSTDADCFERSAATSSALQDGNVLTVEIVLAHHGGWSNLPCAGTEVFVPQFVTAPGSMMHVHVPQLCLTTTSTCVGPIDKDVQTPAQLQTISVCQRYVEFFDFGGTWTRANVGPASCTSVPVG